jgi:hypothetical protein
MLSPMTIVSRDQGPKWTAAWDDSRDPAMTAQPSAGAVRRHLPFAKLLRFLLRARIA